MFLHPSLQLAISINLESVFYLSNIVFLPVWVVNNPVINAKICGMPSLPNIQQLPLLMLR